MATVPCAPAARKAGPAWARTGQTTVHISSYHNPVPAPPRRPCPERLSGPSPRPARPTRPRFLVLHRPCPPCASSPAQPPGPIPRCWPAAAIRRPWPPTPRPAALLRGALPAGRGRFQLLRAAHGRERLALGPAHAGRLRLQYQGIPAVHRPPDAAVRPARRHPRGLDGWPAPFLYYNDVPGELRDELWRRYTLALEPLRLPGKLGAVHFQFPPWIRRDARGHAALAEAARRMDEHLISIELRHRSWFDSPPRRPARWPCCVIWARCTRWWTRPPGRRTTCPPSGQARIPS